MARGKILVSGVKPTGKLHIGNYFGAMKQFLELENEFDSHIFIADLHALTSVANRKELEDATLEVIIDYLAIGLDPKKVTFYKQSDIPEVAELAWIFGCLTTMPYLARAHAFKAAIEKYNDAHPAQRSLASKLEQLPPINMGVYTYPLLMAADILVMDADIVPVGKDQVQHVEITREIARTFNSKFGQVFKEPKEIVHEETMIVPGIDGRKMSKSYGNTISLFASDEEIRTAVMSIPTDSRAVNEPKDMGNTVFAFHKLFTEGPEFEEVKDKYEAGGMGYKESKEILIKNMIKFISPLRDKRAKLANDKDFVRTVLREGGKVARKQVEKKMKEVREKVGLTLK